MQNENKNTLAKLKAQRAKLDARIQAVEARAKGSERKKETRRKILVGSYFLEQAQQANQMDDLRQKMDNYLKRNSDRQLFDLPDLTITSAKT
jgi:large subunit ribosomal protein L7/L12